MAFTLSSVTPTETASATHNVNYGATGADDLLIYTAAFDGNREDTSYSDFTQLINLLGNGTCVLNVGWRKATGSEGSTFTVTQGSAERGAHDVFRFTAGHADPTVNPPEVSTGTEGVGGSDPDPDSLTPSGGSKAYLWMALAALDDDSGPPTVTTWPTNFDDNQNNHDSGGGGGHCVLLEATREVEASSQDPSAFVLSDNSEEYAAATVALYPAAGAGGFTQNAPVSKTVTENAATVGTHRNVAQASEDSLTLSSLAAEVSIGTALSQNATVSLSVTANQATVNAAMNISPSAEVALDLVANIAGLLSVQNIQGASQALSLVPRNAPVVVLSNSIVQTAPDAKTLTEHSMQLTMGWEANDVVSLSVTENQANVARASDITQGAEVEKTLTENQVTLGFAVLGNTDSFTLTANNAQAEITGIIFSVPDSKALTEQAANVNAANAIVGTGEDSFTITPLAAPFLGITNVLQAQSVAKVLSEFSAGVEGVGGGAPLGGFPMGSSRLDDGTTESGLSPHEGLSKGVI